MKSIRWFAIEALIAIGAALIGWFLPDGLNQLAHLLHQSPFSVSPIDRFLSALVVFLFSTSVELIIAVREAARSIQDTLPTRVQDVLDSSVLKLFLENIAHNPQSATSIQRVANAAISPLTQGSIQVFEPRAVIIERALANAAQDIRLLSSSGLEVDIYDNNEITLRLANSSHFYRQIQRKAYQVPEEWTQTWMRFVDELGVKGITCEYIVLMERKSLIADRKKLDSMAKYLSAHRWEFLYCNLQDVLDSFGGALPTNWNLEVFDQKLVKIQETPAGYYHGGIRLKVALHSMDERPELWRLNTVVSKHAKRYSPGLFRAE
jgi:hypothetical protein